MCQWEKGLPWGVSWERVLRWKKCVQICKANKWGVQKPGCAHERMWNWTSFYTLIHAFTRNQAVKCVLVRKRFALRGFLGACPSVKKMCTNLQSKQMRRSKTWLRSRKDVKLNFLLCCLPIFFPFFQSSVKGITLNEKLSTFSFFLFHLLFFFLLFNLILCCN